MGKRYLNVNAIFLETNHITRSTYITGVHFSHTDIMRFFSNCYCMRTQAKTPHILFTIFVHPGAHVGGKVYAHMMDASVLWLHAPNYDWLHISSQSFTDSGGFLPPNMPPHPTQKCIFSYFDQNKLIL